MLTGGGVKLGDGAARRCYGRGDLGARRAPAAGHGQRRGLWGELAGAQVQQAPRERQLRHGSAHLVLERGREIDVELKCEAEV